MHHQIEVRQTTLRRHSGLFTDIDAAFGTDINTVHFAPSGRRENDIGIQVVRCMTINFLYHVKCLS